MNNNRIEIVVISMLLFSFIFFLVSYSNYDLRKKRGWTGETSSLAYNGKKAMESNGNQTVNVNNFLKHAVKRNVSQQITNNESGIRARENNLTNSKLGSQKIYAQLLFRDNVSELYSDVKYSKFTKRS